MITLLREFIIPLIISPMTTELDLDRNFILLGANKIISTEIWVKD